MFKQIKKALPIALVGVFAIASVAWATSAGVKPGTLIIASSSNGEGDFSEANQTVGVSSGISFSDLGKIDVTKSLPSGTAIDYVFVADNRGTNAGFSANVSATPLTASVADLTATGNVKVSIPANEVLKVTANNPAALNNSKSLPQATALASPVGSIPVTIMTANKGRGAGAYLSQLNYTLTLPNYLPSSSTLTPDSDKSAFKNANVSEVGLFAGTYSTTITYSLSAAP
jgi:hypothetical protein